MTPQDARQIIGDHLARSAELKLRTAAACAEDIWKAAALIATVFKGGGKLMLCGNGGSAADCQHFAAELVSRLSQEFKRPGLPAMALTTDSSVLTAYANDYDFDGVFARQVQALGRPGDALFGISTSGSSKNVVRAVTEARTSGMKVITLTADTGTLPAMADVAIRVPGSDTQHLQETHLAIEHLICHIVEREVYGAGL